MFSLILSQDHVPRLCLGLKFEMLRLDHILSYLRLRKDPEFWKNFSELDSLIGRVTGNARRPGIRSFWHMSWLLWLLGEHTRKMLKPRGCASEGPEAWPWLTQAGKCPPSNLVPAGTGSALNWFLKLPTPLHNIRPVEKLVWHETSHGSKQVTMTVFAYHWGFSLP